MFLISYTLTYVFSSVLDSDRVTPPIMPPKTVKKKPSEKCKFFNRGYCKNKEACENLHNDKVCDDLDCDEKNCDKRHPNPCRFGPRCQFKKRKECLYLHVTLVPNDDAIEALNLKFTNTFKQLEKDSEQKDSEIKSLKGKMKNLEDLLSENKFKNMRKDLESKNLQINGLETRLGQLENIHQTQRKEQEKRIKELEKIIKCRDSKFKCKQCEYSTGSEQGLKSHISKKHKPTTESLEFPRSCHLCDKNLQSIKEYKIHMKTHSHRLIQYQCNMCSFSEYNDIGIEVHVGREHGEIFECGMCEFITEDLERMDVHLLTCEVYKCNKCESIFKNLQDLKQHSLENDTHKSATHIKQSREDKHSYDAISYTFEDLFQI